MNAVDRLAPKRMALLKSAEMILLFKSLAFTRLAPDRSVPHRSAPEKSASWRFARDRLALRSSNPDRSRGIASPPMLTRAWGWSGPDGSGSERSGGCE